MTRLLQYFALLSMVLVVSGCTKYSVAVPSSETDLASIEGPVIFVSINGVKPDAKPKRHEIPAGRNEIVILYRSYVQKLECTYEFDAVAGHRYEFVTRSNPDPITLYRIARENWLLSTRHEPTAPRECTPLETSRS